MSAEEHDSYYAALFEWAADPEPDANAGRGGLSMDENIPGQVWLYNPDADEPHEWLVFFGESVNRR